MPWPIDGSSPMMGIDSLPSVEENGDEGVFAPSLASIVDRRSGEGLGSPTVRVEDHFDSGEAASGYEWWWCSETTADRLIEGVEAISVFRGRCRLGITSAFFQSFFRVDSEFPRQSRLVSPCLLADINGDVATVLSIRGDTMAVNGMVSEEGLVSSRGREASRPPPPMEWRHPPMSSGGAVSVAGEMGRRLT
ncbi:hypothetical protein Dimus_030462 [Dionaea muscipula]